MEIDLRDSGQLLFSWRSKMASHNLHNGSQVNLYALNRGNLGGFTQLQRNKIVLVAKEKNCIIVWKRGTTNITILAGKCKDSGDNREDIFDSPTGIIKDMKNSDLVIVADTKNQRVRSVNVTSGEVSNIVTLREDPYALFWVKDKLLVSSSTHLNLVVWENHNPTVNQLNGNKRGQWYGEFSRIEFNTLHSLQYINPDWIIATEKSSGKAIFLNIESKTALPVCLAHLGCSASTQIDTEIYNTLKTNDGLYVAGVKGIKKLTGKLCLNTIHAFIYQTQVKLTILWVVYLLRSVVYFYLISSTTLN